LLVLNSVRNILQKSGPFQDRLIKGFVEIEKKFQNENCSDKVGGYFGSYLWVHYGGVSAPGFVSCSSIYKAWAPVHFGLGFSRVEITVVACSFTLQGGFFQNLISQLRSLC
jgi:hypothetical protein